MLRSGARIASRATWRAAAVNGSVPVLSSARAAGVRSASSEVNNNVNTIYARTGLDPNYFRGRKVVIYKPPTGSTQNGKHSGSQWKLQFDMQQKWSNPLMGWTSGKDTLGSQVFGHLGFDSPAEAKAWCDKLSIEYRIDAARESSVNKKIAKRYEDNFRWDGDEVDGDCEFGHYAAGRAGCK